MTAQSLDNFVIIFPDPTTLPEGSRFLPQRVPSNISFASRFTTNIRTLSTNDADPDGSIQGLLYVPDLDMEDPCYNTSQAIIPEHVTRQKNLPDIDFNLIALAPWINANCTKSYLRSAHFDPIRAFIFYLPDNGTAQPPPVSDSVWSLDDGGQWKGQNPYPVYALPGSVGAGIMTALSTYSGNVSSVPFGSLLLDTYDVDPRDYIRVYTEIAVSSSSSLPGLWVFLLIVIGALAIVLSGTSFLMHWLQRRRRDSLRRRVANGEVDLEALGIKRLTVPQNIIDKMPLFIYTCNGNEPNTKAVAEAPNLPTDTKSSEVATYKVDANSSPPDVLEDHRAASNSLTTHDYLPHSQPTCPICLDDFVSGSTTIRELPCFHIFHPECIDSFLSNNSSLCPMCKKSTLPFGYCPEVITNAMVTRERAIRRLRGRIVIPADANDPEGGNGSRAGPIGRLRSAIRQRLPRARHEPEVIRAARDSPPAYTGGVQPSMELQPVLQTSGLRPTEQNPHLTRGEIAQLRARELLGGTVSPVDEGVEGRAGWRRALAKVFPGFK